jgi:hypothetical protein
LRVERRLLTPELSSDGRASTVTDLRFSPDGRSLGVLMLGGVAFVDVASQSFDFAELPQLAPAGLRFASDGRVAVFGRRAVYTGRPDPAAMEANRHTTRGTLHDVEFRRDGSLLLVGDGIEEELATLLE